MSNILDIIGLVFIAIGLAFDLFGCLGLLRLPDVYNRLQAATKCITLGTCSILFGMFLVVGRVGYGIFLTMYIPYFRLLIAC